MAPWVVLWQDYGSRQLCSCHAEQGLVAMAKDLSHGVKPIRSYQTAHSLTEEAELCSRHQLLDDGLL